MTPFILLTANSPQAFILEAYGASVTDVFEKRSSRPLVTMLQRLLAHREPATGTVLVVEDASAQAAFFVGVMSAIGLECDVVKSAEEALDKLAGRAYDLIVVNIMLAGCMSGVTLANQIRRLPGDEAWRSICSPPLRSMICRVASSCFTSASTVSSLTRWLPRNLPPAHVTSSATIVCCSKRVRHAVRPKLNAQEAIRALAHRASHDALTGLANRWMFEERLTEALDGATSATTGLAMLDVGALRIVNDACGHAGW